MGLTVESETVGLDPASTPGRIPAAPERGVNAPKDRPKNNLTNGPTWQTAQASRRPHHGPGGPLRGLLHRRRRNRQQGRYAPPVLARAGGWKLAGRAFDGKLQGLLKSLNEAFAA
jgi:hypothetical protein